MSKEAVSGATPRPWKAGQPAWYRGRSDDDTGKIPVTAGDAGVIGNVYGTANAALIVAAVNSYDAHVQAVEALRGLLWIADSTSSARSHMEAFGAARAALAAVDEASR